MRLMQYAGAAVAGGLLRHVEILTIGLIEAGHEVHAVLSPSSGAEETAAFCERAGAQVTRLTVEGKTDLPGLLRFRSLVGRERPDVLHMHLSSPVEAIPALLSARWGRARRVVTTEHAPTWSPLARVYSRMAKRAATRSIDQVIALSRADASYLSDRFGVPRERLAVIPNGVPGVEPAPSRAAARARLGLGEDRALWIGCAGSLETKKGPLDLIEAVKQVCAAEPGSAAVALAGEGSLETELRALAGSVPFPLKLLGRLPGIGALLAAVDLFALPSHQEAMPLALLEAMSAGLPIVATRVGGVPEAIEHDVHGLLVEPSRPESMAAALRRLMGDGALRRRLGEAARARFAAEFDSAIMVRRVEALYRSLTVETAP